MRQAFHRAKEHIAKDRPRFAPSSEAHTRLGQAFLAAVLEGDVEMADVAGIHGLRLLFRRFVP
jgi:hypothetical protein